VKLLAALVAAAAVSAGTAQAARLPDTTSGVHVFSDQLPDGLSPGLLRFAAMHYAGAQKLGLSETKALKRINPSFFMIQYRLALGLGSTTSIRFGDTWRREWPASPKPEWFALYDGQRVQSSWGWYLTNLDDRSWRAYYTTQLREQIASTDADGAFLDSASIPNEFGGSTFRPNLPDYDPAFESVWRAKLERWLPAVETAIRAPVIANAGELVTTRDHTDYSRIAGIMVEGFAFPSEGRWFAPSDWQLQADRIVALERKGRIVIGQTYPAEGDVQARMFALATYLLVKAEHTFLNFGDGIQVSWFPEYGVDLGAPAGATPKDTAALRDAHGAFVRRYARGLVFVNPGESGITESLPAGYAQLVPAGGGAVPADGTIPAGWRLDREPLQTLTLAPHSGAVLVQSSQ
jgi:putative glycosyl hydrolase-like family 15 (GHL15) protein